jgi:hypothetical protein
LRKRLPSGGQNRFQGKTRPSGQISVKGAALTCRALLLVIDSTLTNNNN